jgi:hypothetical protein
MKFRILVSLERSVIGSSGIPAEVGSGCCHTVVCRSIPIGYGIITHLATEGNDASHVRRTELRFIAANGLMRSAGLAAVVLAS